MQKYLNRYIFTHPCEFEYFKVRSQLKLYNACTCTDLPVCVLHTCTIILSVQVQTTNVYNSAGLTFKQNFSAKFGVCICILLSQNFQVIKLLVGGSQCMVYNNQKKFTFAQTLSSKFPQQKIQSKFSCLKVNYKNFNVKYLSGKQFSLTFKLKNFLAMEKVHTVLRYV